MSSENGSSAVSHDKLKNLIRTILRELGIPEEDAEIASNVLIAADLRGVDSHGVARLKVYAKALRLGLINKNPQMKVLKDSTSAVLVDADNGLGIVTAPRIMQMCIERARETGTCTIGTKNTNHFGIAGYYTMMAAEQGMLSVCSANTLPLTAPFGGRERMLGSDPISIGAPAGKYDDFILDMATATVALGKIEIAIRNKQRIPEDWIISPEGRKTDDPNDFFRGGALLPMAGPKGYGLAVMVEVFSALLVGAGVGKDVGYALLNEQRENIGHFMTAIDVSKFRPLEEFKADVDKYYEMIKHSERAEGVKEIFLPGEIEARTTRQRLETGIPVNAVVAGDVLELAKSLGLCEEREAFQDLIDRVG